MPDKSPDSFPFLTDVKELPMVEVAGFKFTLEIGELSSDLKEKARKELRETPDLQKTSSEELKQLIRDEDDLVAPIESEAWLIRFLRPTKYYPESALSLVKHYYSYKVRNKHIYDELVPSKANKAFQHDLIMVLPRRDQDGRRVIILTIGKKWKHKEVQLDEILKGAILFIEAAMLEPATQVNGASVILDMDGLTMQQAWQFTPPFAKRIVDLLQDSVALRVKGIHIINQPYVFNMVFSLFKPFLREKLKNRIYFHGTDRKSLHSHLGAACLPESYDGTLDIPPFHAMKWFEALASVEQEFAKINQYGYKKASKK